MSQDTHIQIYGATDVGCVRSGNEDCFLIVEQEGEAGLNPDHDFEVLGGKDIFIAVSDGMGGAAAGEVASETALETLSRYVRQHALDLADADPKTIVATLEEGVHTANRAIFQKAQELANRKGMGATITAAYLQKGVLYIFQIGDSRAYVLRDGKLSRITRDQSFVGHLVEMGTITEEQAMRHPQRNVILQALGTQEKLKIDVSFLPLCKGDLVLLCSDGLYGEFFPGKLEEIVQERADGGLIEIVDALLEDAKSAGGRDNITVIGLRILDGFPERECGEAPRYRAFVDLEKDNPLEGNGLLQ